MDIYQPAEDSYLLQSVVRQYAQGRVLDMGTGSGIQAKTAIENPNVKEVVAVDINKKAVDGLRGIRKINSIVSDLFENVSGKFSTIVFNPPYLPADKSIEDPALYGGKKGWEISMRFFSSVSEYLFNNGEILFLFSSLTNKKKIEEILEHHLLSFEQVSSQKLAFEELYVYRITKSSLLRELEGKNIQNISYFTKGRRGVIYTGIFDKNKLVKTHLSLSRDIIKVAIKVEREGSGAIARIENESNWLQRLNEFNIGPRFMFSGENYCVYCFVEGRVILNWLVDASKQETLFVLKDMLGQCFEMDKLRVNKEEMHHPIKHILVDYSNRPVLLDFERCHNTDKPQNVTQFVEFICRLQGDLASKGVVIDVVVLRKLAKEYKDTYLARVFEEIKNSIS